MIAKSLQLNYLLLVVFCTVSCTLREQNKTLEMKFRGGLKISKVERGESGNLVIFGEVVNGNRVSVSIPWLGNAEDKDGIVLTSLGSLDVKDGRGWKKITEFKDGIRPLVVLQSGASVKFCFPTTVPFPKEKKWYRLILPNMKPVEFMSHLEKNN